MRWKGAPLAQSAFRRKSMRVRLIAPLCCPVETDRSAGSPVTAIDPLPAAPPRHADGAHSAAAADGNMTGVDAMNKVAFAMALLLGSTAFAQTDGTDAT